MTESKALDLNEVDPPIWRVLSGKIAYGPYTLGQLQRLILDHQLTQTSKVAMGDGSAFKPAREHPAILRLFSVNQAKPITPRQQSESSDRYLLTVQSNEENLDLLREKLNDLGEFAELLAGTFVLKTDRGLANIQRHLRHDCDAGVAFILIQARTGRLAWSGLDHDTGDHIRGVWKTSG